MLLIFGLSVFFRTVSRGTFHCPNCGGDRRYRRRVARRWFTFFFVPVIPLRRLGETVECEACRTRFGVSVLRLPTVRQMTEALPAGMRAAVATVLTADGSAGDASRRRAVEAVRGYGDEEYGDEALELALVSSGHHLDDEIARAGAQLATEAKEWFLAQVVRVALADGPLSDGERQALHRVADRLGMTSAHAFGVIVMTEGAANP
ncbi:zinc-ribbon domain-containing protein [Actinomadura sp. HBU206391]|uniref:tellurite resistance TerB family protein n=1 Tax=Actinomadura sp. HBU206391 TaxID=2731692 RepID=UPI00164F1A5C|nr:zinc-ribbon domain-containing protein [Actinomadura sp. HBU206391]MBC6461638.1 zinc-ribbon domain-containing protein [Actinomadura sp. HBU206391]